MALRVHREAVCVPHGPHGVNGALTMPEDCIGVVVCAHDDGSLRQKPSNAYVATALREARLGTLLLDVLAGSGPAHASISLLADRLGAACDWLHGHERAASLPIGLYGSSYCAAAALQHAAMRGHDLAAIVLRSGWPELAGQALLSRISVPTLLIVGGLDDRAVSSNRTAYAALSCRKRLEIVPGADHAFEQPGNPEVVARLARSWFLQYAPAQSI